MPSITVAGAYTPGNPASQELPLWFYITFPDDVGTCTAMLVISSPSSALTGPGGNAITFAFDELRNAVGTTSSRYSLSSFGGGKIITDTIRISPPASLAGGTYSQSLTLSLYENGALIARAPMTITVNVTSACTLPTPDVTSMDFSPGVDRAQIQHGYTQTAVIQGAFCTGPARLSLRATPMTTDEPASAAFANHIDFNATATMGAARAMLSTSAASEAAIPVDGSTAPVTIAVALQAGAKRLAAGRYASSLRVTLEPAN